ncbi:MAG: hypothetical protein ACO2OW_00005, partial [Minisyncoccia bacterium]
MSGKNFFLYSLLLSFVINFFLYFIFENKSAIGQGAYCQPLPYLTFSGSWPGQGYLVMTSSTPNVLVRYTGGTLITGSGSANYISKWTSASTLGNSIIYDNGTNVGIGTTNPAYKLDVSGDVRVTGTLYANAISGTYTGTINAANVSSGQFGANTGGGNYSFPGNVGIGTTAPNGMLHIQGGSGSIGLRLGLNPGQPAGYTNSPMLMWDSTNMGATRVYWMRQEGNYWRFKVSDTSWGNLVNIMTVDTSGNVGIGMTNPTAKLDVNGNIKASMISWTGMGMAVWDSAGTYSWVVPAGVYRVRAIVTGGGGGGGGV